MTLFSSKSTELFYDSTISPTLPADAIAITHERRESLLEGQRQGKKIDFSAEDGPVLVDPPAATCPELCAQIDEAADRAREAVAGDPLRAVEYQRAAIEAKAFKDAGYPAGSVPPMVEAWAIGGRTAQQAADNILSEEAAYNGALVWLRTTRLAAKEQIRTLMDAGNYAAAKTLSDATVSAIRATVAGIGNNAGGAQ